MFARDHLLIEGLPGRSKTTWPHALADMLGLSYKRMRFTSDLLPEPFFVLATQNPIHQSGIYPLPESQQDRFRMRLELGYPHHPGRNERCFYASPGVCGRPRGALALLDCARTWTVMESRGHLVPEDLQMVLPDSLGGEINPVSRTVIAHQFDAHA